MSSAVVRFLVLAACVAALHAWLFVFLGQSTIVVDEEKWRTMLHACAALVSFGLLTVMVLRLPLLGAALVALGLVAAGGRGGLTLGYLTYSLDRHLPLWDAQLARLDAAMGFDWLAMLKWLDAQPLLANIAFHCYSTFQPEHIAVPLILIMASQVERAQTAILAGLMGLVVTHGVAYVMPAAGAYDYFQVLASQHPNIDLASAGRAVAEFARVRSGELVALDAGPPLWLIAFPSYAALMAVVFAWALWSVPYLRWPGLALNAGLLVATPLHGSQHLSGVLVGAGLAVVCIAFAAKIMARIKATRSLAAPEPLTWTPAR